MSKISAIFLLILIVLISGCIGKNEPTPFERNATQETSIPNNTVLAPEETTAHESMVFGATVESASYRYPGHWFGAIDEENAKKEIDAISELGADFIRIDIRNETLNYPEEVKKLDNIVAYGRSKNLKIYFGAFGMETWMASWLDMFLKAPDGGGGKASWEDFKRMYSGEVSYLIGRYKPDYIMIIVEARRNIGNQVGSKRTVDEWVAYTKELAAMIKSSSPGTKIVLNEVVRSKDAHSSADYVEGIMKDNDNNIDIIGIDPYSLDELYDEMNTSLKLAKQYNWHGKLWVGETNVFNYKGDDYQKEYFETAIELAKKNNFEGFVVFYTREIPKQSDSRGIIRNDFAKKPAYWLIKEKIREIKSMPAR